MRKNLFLFSFAGFMCSIFTAVCKYFLFHAPNFTVTLIFSSHSDFFFIFFFFGLGKSLCDGYIHLYMCSGCIINVRVHRRRSFSPSIFHGQQLVAGCSGAGKDRRGSKLVVYMIADRLASLLPLCLSLSLSAVLFGLSGRSFLLSFL